MARDEIAMHSKPYPTSEERVRVMERRQALLDELMAPRFWLRPEERPQHIERLNREYGSDEVQRMMAISEELAGQTGKSRYERCLDLYCRFGGGRRLVKPGEHSDLSARQAWLKGYKKSGDPPLTPAQEERLKALTDLLMRDWPLWDDLVPENPPAEMPERIEITHNYPPPLDRLLAMGKRHDVDRICQEVQLKEAHIPGLIRMALDKELLWAPRDAPKVYAPTHAVQLLRMIGAEEAAEPLLGLLDLDQDWVGEELPDVYAGIGSAAIPHLQAYLADPEQYAFARIRAAHTLKEIATAHPAERDRVVAILHEHLRQGRQVDRTLNAFLISYLTDLRAEEVLDDVKAAYLADKVDLTVVGNWNDVLQKFGLPPDPEIPSRSIWDGSPLADVLGEVLRALSTQTPRQPARRPEAQAKGGRKAARRARKRARRKRKKR